MVRLCYVGIFVEWGVGIGCTLFWFYNKWAVDNFSQKMIFVASARKHWPLR